ncbi:MAG: DNA-directed RNA polymerase subunit alpha [Patescibacteria group bacterium]|jgi:DNA-directed RNA polymerase subunit alpha
MKNISLPVKIEYQADEKNKNKGSVIVEPCYPGYGNTWGNALRRVLLSSLEGAAVTAVKIKGAKYEFSAMSDVSEDILDIILNLKSLRIKILSDTNEPIKLNLKASGEKKITAGDITPCADVEILNPELIIATLTDKKVHFEMDIWVQKGYSWISSEEKSREGLEVGTIVTDSIFTPVVQVAVNIENVRVGKRTDFDKLIVTIETNGALTPQEAFNTASQLLTEQFSALTDGSKLIMETKATKEKTKAKKEKKEKKTVVKSKKKSK